MNGASGEVAREDWGALADEAAQWFSEVSGGVEQAWGATRGHGARNR